MRQYAKISLISRSGYPRTQRWIMRRFLRLLSHVILYVTLIVPSIVADVYTDSHANRIKTTSRPVCRNHGRSCQLDVDTLHIHPNMRVTYHETGLDAFGMWNGSI